MCGAAIGFKVLAYTIISSCGAGQQEGRVHKSPSRQSAYPANTKHLYNIFTMLAQRRRRWANVVEMLYKCCVFAGYVPLTYDTLLFYSPRNVFLML